MRGRKPEPTALKLLKGAEPRHINKHEPKFAAGAEMPSWLDGRAKKEWKRLAPMLATSGVLTAADAGLLAVNCDAWSEMVTLRLRIQREGRVIHGDKTSYRNPITILFREACDRYIKSCVELGLTPSARSRVKAIPPTEEKNPWADI